MLRDSVSWPWPTGQRLSRVLAQMTKCLLSKPSPILEQHLPQCAQTPGYEMPKHVWSNIVWVLVTRFFFKLRYFDLLGLLYLGRLLVMLHGNFVFGWVRGCWISLLRIASLVIGMNIPITKIAMPYYIIFTHCCPFCGHFGTLLGRSGLAHLCDTCVTQM